MSQIFKASTASPPPPTSLTTIVTDSGTVLVAANTVNMTGGQTSVDNDNGVRTIANPNNSNNEVIQLTNRLTGSGTSVNAASADLITFALGASAAVYRFSFYVSGRDTGTGDGLGYTVDGSARTNGAAATIISTPDVDADEDASLLTATIDLVASGNNVILRVNGVVGQTITYKAVGTYVVV